MRRSFALVLLAGFAVAAFVRGRFERKTSWARGAVTVEAAAEASIVHAAAAAVAAVVVVVVVVVAAA